MINEGTVLTRHPAAGALASRGIENLVAAHLDANLTPASSILATPTLIEGRKGWMVEADVSDTLRHSYNLTIADGTLIVTAARLVDLTTDPFDLKEAE